MSLRGAEPLLSIDKWASLMGLNPLPFFQASAAPLAPCYCSVRCEHVWYENRGHWNRQLLRRLIADAEREIEDFLGVPLCPVLRCKTLPFEQAICSNKTRVQLGNVKPLNWGVRTEAALDTVTFDQTNMTGVEVDDGAGGAIFWPQTVEIALTVACDVAACELSIKAGGSEICTRSLTVTEKPSGVDCVMVATIDAWLLLRPELFDEWPIAAPGQTDCPDGVIDLLDLANYVDEVTVCRTTYGHEEASPMAELGFFGADSICGCGGQECPACQPSCVPACWQVDPRVPGSILVQAAEWAPSQPPPDGGGVDAGGAWCSTSDPCCWQCRPDFVRVYYWESWPLGEPSREACGGCGQIGCADCPPPELLTCIAELAAARLPCKSCNCSCSAAAQIAHLGEDLARVTGSEQQFMSFGQAENIFGTRRGELNCYRRLTSMKSRLVERCPELYVRGFAPAY